MVNGACGVSMWLFLGEKLVALYHMDFVNYNEGPVALTDGASAAAPVIFRLFFSSFLFCCKKFSLNFLYQLLFWIFIVIIGHVNIK